MGLLDPLYYVVSLVLVWFHQFWSLIFAPTSGWAWALSIVGLVVVIRIILIPLFVRQIKAQRGLQVLQPQIKEIQQKYKNDREKQSQELMKLYKDTGTNPLSSCLPIVAQMPIFFALYHVLNVGVRNGQSVGAMSTSLALQAKEATIFGAPLSSTFTTAHNPIYAAYSPLAIQVVSLVLIALMTVTTFTTQRQLMVKNMPSGQSNPMAQQQKILVYVFPIMFAVFGINFPIGVLIYWFTTNLWSMGQQFYVIRNNPAPGTPAYDEWQARKAARAVHRGAVEAPVVTEENEPPAPPRVQPKRQPRAKRSGQRRPAGGSATSDDKETPA